MSIMGADKLSGAGQNGEKASSSQTTRATVTEEQDGLPTPVLEEKNPEYHVTHLHHSAALLPGDREGDGKVEGPG